MSNDAVSANVTLPSAALNTDGSLEPNACSLSLNTMPSKLQASSRSPHGPYSPYSQPEPLQDRGHGTVLIASWGQYQTLAQMRTSPYYFYIDLPISSDNTTASPLSLGSFLSQKSNTAASKSLSLEAEQAHSEQHLTLYAVHPIPIRYLRSLAQNQLEFLYGYLVGKRFRPGGELAKRLYETMDCIGQIMRPEQGRKNV